MGWSIDSVPKDARPWVKEALSEGWSARCDGSNHTRLTKSGCSPITIPTTPSDYRWRKNCRAALRRSGLLVG